MSNRERVRTEERRRRRNRIIRNVVLCVLLLCIFSPFVDLPDFHPLTTINGPDTPVAEDDSHVDETNLAEQRAESSPMVASTPNQEQSNPPDAVPKVAIDSTEALQQRKDVQAAREEYEKHVAAIGFALLDRHGGTQWAHVQRFAQQGQNATQPQQSIAAYDEASRLLLASAPDIRLREVETMIRQEDFAAALTQLLKLCAEHPKHAGVGTAVQETRRWPSKAWLGLAHKQAENAAPDDPGFSELWLSIASTAELHGDSSASREAYRRAWEAAARMTNVERAIEISIDLIDRQRITVDPLQLRVRLSETAKLCSQVAEPIKRAEYLADLAGLAHLLDDATQSNSLLQQVTEAASQSRSKLRQYLPEIHRCRTLSWYSSSADILEICKDVPKYNGRIGLDPFPANAMCYGYAAIAAARQRDERSFVRATLLAESQLACVNGKEYVNPFARHVLARADLVGRNWQRAVISANNLADPELRAALLFSVLANAPQEVSLDELTRLIEARGGMRYATLAVAAFLNHRLMTGCDLAELHGWIHELPLHSLRSAAYTGFATASHVGIPNVISPAEKPLPAHSPQPNFRAFMEQAQQSANHVQTPIDRAYCWILIARNWQLAEKPESYRLACDEVRAACLQQWSSVWRKRPDPRAGLGDYYYASHPHYYFDHRHRDQEAELEAVGRICDCLIFLAERQVEVGDAQGAIQSCIDAARASQAHTNDVSKLFYFLRMEAVAAQAAYATKIPPLVFQLDMHPMDNVYRSCLVAAWSQDIAQLQKLVVELENGRNRVDSSGFARSYAELSLLSAKHKAIEDYREARRKAVSLIERQNAWPEIQLMLAEADANAGELALAANSLTKQSLMWYGTQDRPRSTLIIKLVEAGRLQDAQTHYAKLSQPYWKLRAMQAIAKSKAGNNSPPSDVIGNWVAQLADPIDRVGALCGVALATQQ